MFRKLIFTAAAACAVLLVTSASVKAQTAPAKWGLSGVESYSVAGQVVKVSAWSWHIPGYASDRFQFVSSQGYLLGQATEFYSAAYVGGILTLVVGGTWQGSRATFTIAVKNDGTYQEPMSVSVTDPATSNPVAAINPDRYKPQSGWLHIYYL